MVLVTYVTEEGGWNGSGDLQRRVGVTVLVTYVTEEGGWNGPGEMR